MTEQFANSLSTPSPAFDNVPLPSDTLTPQGSALEDAEGDTAMDDGFGENIPKKRRRTFGSFDAERRSIPPNLRNKPAGAPPSTQQIQELIQNADCSPYHLVCQKRLFPPLSPRGLANQMA